jgi:glyoxylase-like metal-dependent hydrolase (beta-lactamase superfamily II)/rhodanese-related sulfurtransferase
MSIEIEEINGSNCKTYLLTAGSDAALVDPVRERYDTYQMLIAARKLRLRMVLETHMHADHLMLNRSAKERLGAPFIMHRESPSPLVDHHVVDGDALLLGRERILVLHTPGHTPDSVCYRVPAGIPVGKTAAASDARAKSGVVLTGDTLLIGGSGRTDFPGGDAGKQYDAVVRRLFALSDDTVVLPAHDYKGRTASTIGAEKRENIRFAGKSREAYITLMGSLGLPFPAKIQQALQVNQSGFETDEVSFPAVAAVAAMPELTARDLAERCLGAASPLLLDVREPEEFVGELGHIEGALLVPMDALEHRLPKLAGYVDRDVVVVCRAGFSQVYNLSGGMLSWIEAGLPVQR